MDDQLIEQLTDRLDAAGVFALEHGARAMMLYGYGWLASGVACLAIAVACFVAGQRIPVVEHDRAPGMICRWLLRIGGALLVLAGVPAVAEGATRVLEPAGTLIYQAIN